MQILAVLNRSCALDHYCIHSLSQPHSVQSSKMVDSSMMSLGDIFKNGERQLEFILDENSPDKYKHQNAIRTCKTLLEDSTNLVSSLSIFSTNENLEEIGTNDLRYLLLPAYLGTLSQKLNDEQRIAILLVAEVYFEDFLSRCSSYGLVAEDILETLKDKSSDDLRRGSDLSSLTKRREEKVAKFKQQKERNRQLEDLKDMAGKPHVEDETKRKYYIMLIEKWIDLTIEELEHLRLEKKMLKMKPDLLKEKKEIKRNPEKLKPVIITRNEIQKKVFGAGYPNIPTMTVEEFYDREVSEGRLPDNGRSKNNSRTSCEDESKEVKLERDIEQDDEESLIKARQMDDWKDDHRRGWGNRKNMG